MKDILESKEIILDQINIVFNECNRIKQDKNDELLKLVNECIELRECNKKLLFEVSEKDKLLIINEKKMIDYEHMINKIQEDALKEITEKERFDMLKKQDKEIHDRDIEIKRLEKKVELLEGKLSLLDKSSDVDDTIEEVAEERNENKTLVERMKDVKKEGIKEDVTEVVKNQDDNVEDVTEVVKNQDDNVEEDVTEVVEDVGGEPTEVVENPDDKIEGEDSGEETEELSDEEGEEVDIITHYKKQYYIIVNEKPQYIYNIEDGGLGDKVGELNGKKKVFYNSSKN